MISETAAFETAWAELAPILTALPPAHLDIARRIGRILFSDGIRCGMDVGAGIALGVFRGELFNATDEADAQEQAAIPPAVIVNFNGRKISASRTDTLADIARMLLGDLPDGADVTLQIESVGVSDAANDHFTDVAAVAQVAWDEFNALARRLSTLIGVTVVSGGVSYNCSLSAHDIVEVTNGRGDLLATAEWNAKTGDHEGALFASCDHAIDYDHLNSILAHASEAWRKHRR